MSTAADTTAERKSAGTSLASSVAFGTFAIVFAIAVPILYVIAELLSLPLFTYHPGTNRIDLGWAAARANEGPAMYWYGWTATSLVGGAVLGVLAIFLPRPTIERIPLFLVWFTSVLAMPVLAYALMPFWMR